MSKSGTTAEYTYDHNGLRVRKVVNGVATEYMLHGKLVTGVKKGNEVLKITYDAQSRPAMVKYNGAWYGYVHNLQGDIVGILDNTGAEVVKYTYDAWGKVLSVSGSKAGTLGKANPFRYRGYVYDEESGLYYLRSRYYNPEWGRFLNADDESGEKGELLDHNKYSYCENHPILLVDEDGKLGHLAIGALVGAISGFVGQVVSDVVTSVIKKEVTISSWQTYAGATVGGMAGGITFAATGNVKVAGAVSGGVTTGVSGALEKLTDDEFEQSWAEIGINAAIDAGVGYGLAKVVPPVKGITKGRGNYGAVYSGGMTKLRRGLAKRMSVGVIKKGIKSNILAATSMDVYYGVKAVVYPYYREGLNSPYYAVYAH